MNDPTDRTPSTRATAHLVAGPGCGLDRASAAAMRSLAGIAGRVGTERTFEGPRRISWETPSGEPDGWALSIVPHETRADSTTTFAVRLYADPRGRSMARSVPDDGTPPALLLDTGIVRGEDLRDHASERTLPVLAALARAAAAAIDGRVRPLDPCAWEDAVDAVMDDAWRRFADGRGHAVVPARVMHVPEHPLACQVAQVNGIDGPIGIGTPALPAAMTVRVGTDGIVRMETLLRSTFACGTSDPMAVLRATALLAEAAGGEPPRGPSTTDDGRKPRW